MNILNLKLSNKLQSYASAHLIRRQYCVEPNEINRVIIDDQPLINFASNDYLALAKDDRVKEAFIEGVKRYGLGSSASPMIAGYSKAHQSLEEKFAEFLGRDQAILFNSGYQANLGVISTLSNRGTSIVTDKLCHASIIDAIKLSQANYRRYKHADFDDAILQLSSVKSHSLLITESIFSMEGKIINIKKLSAIAKYYKSLLIVDDAHGFGILGKSGRGICEHYNLRQEMVPCLIIPFGKAVASMGAIVAGDKTLIETLRQFSRSYMYSTALPPAVVFATLETLQIIEKEEWRREKLNELIIHFNHSSKHLGLPILSDEITPIKFFVFKDNLKIKMIQDYLIQKGFFVSCIRPPTVPNNTSRIRVSLNCMHTKNEITQLLELLAKIIEKDK